MFVKQGLRARFKFEYSKEFNVDLMLQFYIVHLFVNLVFSVFTMRAL